MCSLGGKRNFGDRTGWAILRSMLGRHCRTVETTRESRAKPPGRESAKSLTETPPRLGPARFLPLSEMELVSFSRIALNIPGERPRPGDPGLQLDLALLRLCSNNGVKLAG